MAAWPIIIDDDGTGESGTPTDKALFDQIKGYVDTGVPPTILSNVLTTGTVTDWIIPGRGPNTFVEWTGNNAPGASLIINGIGGGVAGDRLTIKNIGQAANEVIWLKYFNAANVNPTSKLLNLVTSGIGTPIAMGGWATYLHDGIAWILIAHEQGALIIPAYNAADFTSDTGTWVVEAADLTTIAYKVTGRTVKVFLYIYGASITGTPLLLYVKNGQWGGYNPSRAAALATYGGDPGGTLVLTFLIAGDPHIRNQRAAGAWPSLTNGHALQFQFEFEIA